MIWKSDWPEARESFTKWWAGDGLALHVTAPAATPHAVVPSPGAPADVETRWLDPAWRVAASLNAAANTYYGGVALPIFDTNIGPGSLGLLMGCRGNLDWNTVWYEPVIVDPTETPLTVEWDGLWWRRHMALIEAGLAHGADLWSVGLPDLIENLDTLVQLRDPQAVLVDMIERPEWVERRIAEINDAFFAVFDHMYGRVVDEFGGNSWCAFAIWGPGKTAKVQCDMSCAISPAMFRRFVRPSLVAQCEWLDYSLYHLDGTQALPQLDNLLSIDALNAIEWTPQAGLPGGGSPRWYELYRRIRAGGKGVQAVGVAYDEVLPLLDAVGHEGMFVMTSAPSEEAARDLLGKVGWRSL